MGTAIIYFKCYCRNSSMLLWLLLCSNPSTTTNNDLYPPPSFSTTNQAAWVLAISKNVTAINTTITKRFTFLRHCWTLATTSTGLRFHWADPRSTFTPACTDISDIALSEFSTKFVFSCQGTAIRNCAFGFIFVSIKNVTLCFFNSKSLHCVLSDLHSVYSKETPKFHEGTNSDFLYASVFW